MGALGVFVEEVGKFHGGTLGQGPDRVWAFNLFYSRCPTSFLDEGDGVDEHAWRGLRMWAAELPASPLWHPPWTGEPEKNPLYPPLSRGDIKGQAPWRGGTRLGPPCIPPWTGGVGEENSPVSPLIKGGH
jgi:hypothetical protein